jgi:hypothetical protein
VYNNILTRRRLGDLHTTSTELIRVINSMIETALDNRDVGAVVHLNDLTNTIAMLPHKLEKRFGVYNG